VNFIYLKKVVIMVLHVFRSLKMLAKQLIVMIVSAVMLLGFTQAGALAVSSRNTTEPVAVPGITEPVAGQNLDELKEQRREWQSRASSLHDRKNDEPDSLGEALNEKLNLEEITEGYDPERESEKAHQRDPLRSR
jgi:hypothetical protein